MKPLSKGDTCRVRLHTGEVVEAEYVGKSVDKKHWLYLYGNSEFPVIASKKPSQGYIYQHVRFVGNPCVHLPVGVSV